MQYLRQLFSLTELSLRSLPKRVGPASIVIIGTAAVVAVLLGMLALSDSLDRTITAEGRPDRAIVLSTGSRLESDSVIREPALLEIEGAPGILESADGRVVASPESLARVRLRNKSTRLRSLLLVRGVQPISFTVHPEVKLVAGRMFTPGLHEVIVGRAAHDQYRGVDIGDEVSVMRGRWKVVGVFESGGSIRESQLLLDAATLNRPVFASVTVVLQSPEAFAGFKQALSTDRTLSVTAMTELEYAQQQSAVTTHLFTLIAYLVGAIMGAAATFGAVTAFYAAVTVRTVEIGTLRAIGFAPSAVVLSMLLEALLLAMLGAIVGAALVAVFLSGNGFQSGAVVTQVHLSARTLVIGVVWACGIGALGGLFPALQAARIPVVNALREA